MKRAKDFSDFSDKESMLFKTRYSKLSLFFILTPVLFLSAVFGYSYFNSQFDQPTHDKIVSDLKKSRTISSDKKP